MAAECALCGKSEGKFFNCSRCLSRSYCGSDCQKKDWSKHKGQCKRQNYILKIDLLPRFITNPRITRTISCPATAKFASFHQVLQVAFGWANTHLYDFDIFDHSDIRGRENRFSGSEPVFKITDLSTGKTIHYNYDFGDGWEHVISCTGRADPTIEFICIDGEGHGCAEDAGGYSGWDDLLKAYDALEPTEEQRELTSWFEKQASNHDSRGLRGEAKWRWDKEEINTVLKELAPSPMNTGVLAGSTVASNGSSAILLISLEKQSFFDKMYEQVLSELRAKTTVTEVTNISSAMQHLTTRRAEHTVVILTDSAVINCKDFEAVNHQLVQDVHAGGTVIFGFLCSNLAGPRELKKFFNNTWGLAWESGNYQREVFSVNRQADPRFTTGRYATSILPQYSMKALHLMNTELEDRVYVLRGSNQSPAVFAKYGSNGGHLGWIGDVNTEAGTTQLLIAMCNL